MRIKQSLFFQNKKALEVNTVKAFTVLGDPAETRTLDPLIKSQLLYQLSYGVVNGLQNK